MGTRRPPRRSAGLDRRGRPAIFGPRDRDAPDGFEPGVDGTGTHTDFTSPGVLVYEPQADGSLELVAVENLVFARAWREAGHDAPPAFFGREYLYLENDPATEADEAHLFEPHFELHIWLYRENPSGLFAPFNPRVTCEHHAGPTLLPTASADPAPPDGTG